MRIGIDMDNTICSTKEEIVHYSNLYCEEKNINQDELWFNYKDDFLNKYLLDVYTNAKLKDGCKKSINNLFKNNTVYIITARTNKYIKNIKDVSFNYLRNYGINVTDVIINAGDKVKECIDNKIDLMIDDSIYNYNKLVENNVNVLLFDENNCVIDNINKFNNWNDLDNIILNGKDDNL